MRTLLASVAFIGLSAALQAQAWAQVSPSDEIIVTATKIEKSVSDLGLSVSVVTDEALTRTDSAEELSQYIPGLQAAVANGNQIAFQIRGIGAVDHQALTPTAAAVYVDGIFQATNVQTGPLLFDLERAEVLKGPQGSLYGRNATAGAINFVSKRPSNKTEGYIAAEYGRFDRFNLKAAHNIPVSDIFALRLSGRYLTQGPAIDNVVTDTAVIAPKEAGGERDEFGLRALGLLQASPNTEVLLKAHYAEDNGINPSPRNEELDLGKHEISVGPDGIQDTDNEFFGASVNVTHNFGKVSLTSLTAYEGYNQDYGFDFAALPQFFGGQTANLAYDRDFTQVSQEFRLNYTSDSLESMVGLYLEAEDFDQEYLVYCGALDRNTLVGSCNYIAASRRVGAAPTPAGASASTLQSLITQERKTAALFTYNTAALSPRLDLVIGARLTFEGIKGRGQGNHIFDNGVRGINNTLSSGNVVGPAIGSNVINETNLSGNIGLNYKPTGHSLIYASLSSGFKSGGFNGEVIDNASHFDDSGLFDAETVKSAELGYKYNQGALRFNFAGFYNDYDSPQARIFRPVTLENGQNIQLNSLTNFDAAKSYGIEAELQYQPTDSFLIGGGVTRMESEIDDTVFVDSNGTLVLDGDDLPFASDLSVTAFVDYFMPLSDKLGLRLKANGKYQSEFSTGSDSLNRSGLETNAFRQNGYEVIDAQAVLEFDNGVEFGVWGRNLTNSDYAVSAYSFFGPTSFRGNPRTYGLSLRYDY